MKEQLEAVAQVLENIEVHGKNNMRRLLACINTISELLKKLEEPNS